MLPRYTDVIIIGAGPSGTVAASLLRQNGVGVLVLEKTQFPRFSIGESLLPQCMQFVEKAGLVDAVNNAGFQFKNGAAFARGPQRGTFDFGEKFTPGWGTTFQVERARFDKLLADSVAAAGVDIRYQHEVKAVTPGTRPVLEVTDAEGVTQEIEAGFILDASGFGRVLPRLLDLEQPSDFPVRESVFTHLADNISDPAFDRDKILITVHPDQHDVWFWLIPLSPEKCSFGVVAKPDTIAALGEDPDQVLQHFLTTTPPFVELLNRAETLFPARRITGYSANVKTLHGPGYALLGNAGEFLDPVFSSGVTIAMKSADLAASALIRQFQGETVDWEQDYARPLKQGVDTFRAFVEAWYDGRLQDIIFAQQKNDRIKQMICSILAGYAWDQENPYVAESERRLNVLANLCKPA